MTSKLFAFMGINPKPSKHPLDSRCLSCNVGVRKAIDDVNKLIHSSSLICMISYLVYLCSNFFNEFTVHKLMISKL